MNDKYLLRNFSKTTIFHIMSILAALPLSVNAEETNLYWGDTHLHTSYSLDSFALGNRSASPDVAYRFAKGLPVVHPGHRAKVQIDRPLDFLVVSDHAEFLGVFPELSKGNKKLISTELGRKYARLLSEDKGAELIVDFVDRVSNNPASIQPLNTENIRKSIWAKIVKSADDHYVPGKFTSFVGWEWSSMPNAQNLHRVIFTPDGGDKALSYLPFSMFDSQSPEDLWKWLDKISKKYETDFVSIGHNMNLSLGRFFPENKENGQPIDTIYAKARQRWEPVEEVLQYKGSSETHPVLSPDDEYADFEIYKHLLGKNKLGNLATASIGSFARSGLKRGLEIENKIGVNPFKFGMIGSTDSHTGLSSVEEDNFLGKYAIDSTPEAKDRKTTPGSVGWDASAAGLAAVWAEENTREAIIQAFKRREVYATSGPRIKLRLFAGWNFKKLDKNAINIASVGYKKGVPMGGDLMLAPKNTAPSFLVQAVKDPKGANLDRIQMVKGWVNAKGKSFEKVYDIAWSSDQEIGKDGKLEKIKSTVDITTGQYTNNVGTIELVTVWTDPDFDSSLNAFYYVRVLQIPTPRHTLYDTIALQKHPSFSKHAAIIRERAYSSPIWYSAK